MRNLLLAVALVLVTWEHETNSWWTPSDVLQVTNGDGVWRNVEASPRLSADGSHYEVDVTELVGQNPLSLFRVSRTVDNP